MSAPLLTAVAAVYAFVSFDYLMQDRPGMALAFLAYAISNLGFVWEAMK